MQSGMLDHIGRFTGGSGFQDDWQPGVVEKPIIGHLLPDVPEEIIHAAGALPVAIAGAGIPLERAKACLPSYVCGHAQGTLELGISGQLDFLDALVVPFVCDTTRNFYHNWQQHVPHIPVYMLRLPKRLDVLEARDLTVTAYSNLIDFLEASTGMRNTLENLAESINLYNRSRMLLRQAYAEVKDRCSGTALQQLGILLSSAMVLPREDHMDMLQRRLGKGGTDSKPKTCVPVYVRGKVWHPSNILEILGETGFSLAGDEIVTGYRSIVHDIENATDPLRAIVDRQLKLPLYPAFHIKPPDIVTAFVSRVVDSGAKGVLFLNPKFCEEAGFETPALG